MYRRACPDRGKGLLGLRKRTGLSLWGRVGLMKGQAGQVRGACQCSKLHPLLLGECRTIRRLNTATF